jgi:hypothetical protein
MAAVLPETYLYFQPVAPRKCRDSNSVAVTALNTTDGQFGCRDRILSFTVSICWRYNVWFSSWESLKMVPKQVTDFMFTDLGLNVWWSVFQVEWPPVPIFAGQSRIYSKTDTSCIADKSSPTLYWQRNMYVSRNNNKMQLCNRIIISKFIEGSTCFERHTAHHKEL